MLTKQLRFMRKVTVSSGSTISNMKNHVLTVIGFSHRDIEIFVYMLKSKNSTVGLSYSRFFDGKNPGISCRLVFLLSKWSKEFSLSGSNFYSRAVDGFSVLAEHRHFETLNDSDAKKFH